MREPNEAWRKVKKPSSVLKKRESEENLNPIYRVENKKISTEDRGRVTAS